MPEEGEVYNAYPRMAEEIVLGPPYLTKYERARIIGIRALQLQAGAPPLVFPEVVGSRDAVKIAAYEVDHGILPVTIIRYRRGGDVFQAIPLRVLLEVERRVVGGRVYR